MFKTLKNAWSIPDLRRKILFTLMIIIVFRFGSVIPVPFLNTTALKGLMSTVNETGSALSYLDMLSGGAFANATLFAMSVTPYINSSIIMQLLTVAIPPLERLAKEGEEGRKKIATMTRYVAVALGLIQGLAYYFYLRNSSYQGTPIAKYTSGWGAGLLCCHHCYGVYRRHGADDVAWRANQPVWHWQRYFHPVVCRHCRKTALYS